MEKLKTYYNLEAKSQPEPSISIAFKTVAKRRMKPKQRTILLTAVIILIMASTLAAGAKLLSLMPRWYRSEELNGEEQYGEEQYGEELYGEEGGNVAQVDVYSHPFSADFRAYIDANDMTKKDNWDGQVSYNTITEDLEFDSMLELADYFDVNIASNSLIPEESVRIFVTRVAYSARNDYAHITIFSRSKLDNQRLLSFNFDFRIDDEPGKSFQMNHGFYEQYGFGVEDGAEQYYTSPINDIEALLLPLSPNAAQAMFVMENILYTVYIGGWSGLVDDDIIYNQDIGTTEDAIEILKEFINAYIRY